jgi:hypothetical protein
VFVSRETEGRHRNVRCARGTSLFFNCGHTFKEFEMKKIIVALVLALGLVTVATGCSDSKPTTKK